MNLEPLIHRPNVHDSKRICGGSDFYKTVSKLLKITTDTDKFKFHESRFTAQSYYLIHGGEHSITIFKYQPK